MCVYKSLTFFIGPWSSLSPAVRKLEKLSLNAMTRQNISCPSLMTFPSSSISSPRNKIYLFHLENIKPFTYSHRWLLRANCESCRLFAMKSWARGRALVSSLWVSRCGWRVARDKHGPWRWIQIPLEFQESEISCPHWEGKELRKTL